MTKSNLNLVPNPTGKNAVYRYVYIFAFLMVLVLDLCLFWKFTPLFLPTGSVERGHCRGMPEQSNVGQQPTVFRLFERREHACGDSIASWLREQHGILHSQDQRYQTPSLQKNK